MSNLCHGLWRKFLACLPVCAMVSLPVFSFSAKAVEPCAHIGQITAYCGFRGPEDMVQVPESNFLIVSQYGGHVQKALSSLVALNPDSLEADVLLHHDGAVFGGATVTIQVNDYWYIGSAFGDRIVKTPIPLQGTHKVKGYK